MLGQGLFVFVDSPHVSPPLIRERARWYLLTHLEMNRFKPRLELENARRLGNGLPIIESFFPGEFLKVHRPAVRNGEDGVIAASDDRRDDVPADLQHFVFLRSTKSELDHFVFDRWNLDFRVRLRYYLDTAGRPATVSDAMMQEFFESCLRYRGRFELSPSIAGIEKMDKVEIISGPFTGYSASVVEVRHSKGELNLQLAIELVSGVMTITMHDVTRHQVVILNRCETDVIRTDFIKYTQNHLLPILEHRVQRVDDVDIIRRDAAMLTRLYRYRHHQVENESARLHFLSLMLICAHLCRDVEGKSTLQQQAQSALSTLEAKGEAAATDVRTYLWIALYIATADARYRDAAKHYVQTHQPKSAKLRKFVSLIRVGKKI